MNTIQYNYKYNYNSNILFWKKNEFNTNNNKYNYNSNTREVSEQNGANKAIMIYIFNHSTLDIIKNYLRPSSTYLHNFFNIIIDKMKWKYNVCNV